MRLNPNTTIIIGPPGTGKTGWLINKAQELIQDGCPPDYLGYISFTRQAVREARDRIIAATGHARDQFIGFRTLHSMMFWLLGLSGQSVLDEEDVLGRAASRDEQRINRLYAYMYGYYRVSGLPMGSVWDKLHTEYSGTEDQWMQWVVDYRAYKEATGKLDFMDMATMFVDRGVVFPFRYLFVDEAQDFTTDQWAAVAQLAKCAGELFVAGDADQAIFEWAGADGSLFDQIEGDRIILEQSHRVPELPHALARTVLGYMGREVLYRPNQCTGAVHWIEDYEVDTLPLANGETWYLLARNNIYLTRLRALLYKRGIYYRSLGAAGVDRRHGMDRHIRRIRWWQEALESPTTLTAYRRKELEKLVPDLDHALMNSLPWYEAFAAWPVDRILYYRSTEDQWDCPKVFIGTFHSSKGAEADNVVLLGDCTRRVAEAYRQGDLAEWKAMYVALTRTRNRLFLAQSTGRNGLPWHSIIGLNPDLISRLS